ncbi:hypothetical protein [Nocardia tengchongensis]|uniref:hypothetical protein n=1 Tax=Nocardia tengchongensis TaxID=2055889 RepID=UPI0036C1C02C
MPEQLKGKRYGPAAKVSLFGSVETQAIDVFCFHIRNDHSTSRTAAEKAGLELVGPVGQLDERTLYHRSLRTE